MNFKNILKLEVKDASVYVGTTFIAQLASFLVVPLFWKEFTPFDFGVIAIVELLTFFLTTFIGIALESGVTRYYYEWLEDDRKKNLFSLWMLNWISTLFLGFIFIYILSFVSRYLFKDVEFYPLLLIGLINSILVGLGIFPSTVIRIKQKAKLYSLLRLSSFFLQLALNIVFVLVLGRGLIGYFSSNIIVNFLLFLVYTSIFVRWTEVSFQGEIIRECLRFSIPLIPTNILSSLYGIIDRFLLQKFISIEALGIYFVGMKFSNILTGLHSGLKLSYSPFLFKNIASNESSSRQNVYRVTPFYIFPLFFVSILISVFIDEFVVIVGPEKYYSIINLVPFFIGFTLISSMYVYFAPGIILSKKTKYMLIPTSIQLLLMVITGVVLIPRYEIRGVVISKYICVSCYLIISILISNRIYKLSYNWRVLLIFSGVFIFFVGIDKALTYYFPLELWQTILLGICISIIDIVISIKILNVPVKKYLMKRFRRLQVKG